MDPYEILTAYLLPSHMQSLPSALHYRRFKKCIAHLTETDLMQSAAQQLMDTKTCKEIAFNYGFRQNKKRHLGYLTKDYIFLAKTGIVIPYSEIRDINLDDTDYYTLTIKTDYIRYTINNAFSLWLWPGSAVNAVYDEIMSR